MKTTIACKHLSQQHLSTEFSFVYRLQSKVSQGSLQKPTVRISEHYGMFDGVSGGGKQPRAEEEFHGEYSLNEQLAISTVSSMLKPSLYCTHSSHTAAIHSCAISTTTKIITCHTARFFYLFFSFPIRTLPNRMLPMWRGKPQECDNFSETSVLEEVGLCCTKLQQELFPKSDVCLWLVDSTGCLRNAF